MADNNEEVSFTDSNAEITKSKIMKDVEHQSTPIQSKKSDDTYEMFKVIQAMIEKQSVKFDEQKNEIQEFKSSVNEKLDIQNIQFQQSISVKFDELKTDINKVQMKCESYCNELKRDIEKIVESVGEQLSLIHI